MIAVDLMEMIDDIDIVDYISQYVDLQKKGGEYWGLSPWTGEKTPSFSVRRETKSFYDFSSGTGGSVYTFICHYFGCSKSKAVRIMADYLGCDEPYLTSRKRMYTTQLCKRYRGYGKTPKQKKEHPRTIYSDSCMEKYEKDPSKLATWEAEGISPASLEKFQVRYDRCSNRLVYPIRDMEGQIVNIGGRTLDPEWKEKKLRKYTYFSHWGDGMDVLYGLYDNMEYVLKAQEVILFEGCKSVLISDTWGIHNTASLLTSHLNPLQMKLLVRLGVTVTFALDQEVPVWEDKNIQRLKQYTNVFYLHDREHLLQPKDAPVDQGQAVFQKLYEQKFRLR